MKTNLLILLAFFTFTFGFSQNNYWIESNFKELNLKGTQYIFPNKYKSFKLDYSACKNYLFNAPMIDYNGNVKTSSFIITLPMPDGSFENFSVVESPVYEPEFAQKFPEIKTFLAYCANHPEWYTRLDITPHGFHAMILGTKNGTVLIDPITHNGGEVNDYFVYYKNDSQNKGDFECLLDEDTLSNFQQKKGGTTAARFGTCELRTYRLAVACTGEYAQFHGGTVPLTAAAQVTTMNRVNGVYERDMAIHMNIIGNNNLLIYLNGATDPYTNNSGATMLNENQTNIDNVIGSSNYDIGHVFSTGGGGIAQLRSPCGTGKARGVTGQGSPIGDYFDIDYVAHEMGHQFGGNHTQNNSCNRNNATAVEPGSASTIMGYAGICAPDVQAHSDDYFHGINLEEIGNFITGTGNSCAVRTALSNNEPSVSYPATTITLPVSTPFALTATGSDPDNDTLTYCWEQMDNQTATMPPISTATGGPNFRSFNPTTSPTRYFPNLPDVIAGNNPTWEVLPTVSRSMDFRVVVRDNAAGGGCNDHTDISVNFVGSAGPFVVTYPTTSGITWDGNTTETVTWNVANTGSGTTVNCGNVNILISYDGGVTFNDTLLANTPNDGSQIITVPNQATTTAIVMVQCAESNGTFFDVSNNVFTITAITNDFTVVANPTSLSVCSGSDAQYTIDVDKIGTFNSNVALSVSGLPAGLSSSFSTNNQNPAYASTLTIGNTTAVASDTYNFTLNATGSTGTKTINLSLTIVDNLSGTVSLTSPANTTTGVSVPTNFTWSSVSGASYTITIATDAALNNVVDYATGLNTASYTSSSLAANTTYYWQVEAYNNCDTIVSSIFSFTTVNCVIYSSTDVPITISSSGTPTINSDLTISGTVGVINDINVIDLTGTHTYISDLTFTLTSPNGTSVVLIDAICSSQNNFNINFDDEAANNNYPCPPTNGGNYIPENPLSAFDGEDANGTWILTIHDGYNQDGGALQTWGIEICFSAPPCNTVTENVSITACDSSQINGTWYYNSTTINDTLHNYFGSGCDSITAYALTINNTLTTSNNQTACDSAQVFGTWYYASQSVSQTYTATSGCDSVHTVNLTINYASPTTTINNTTCDANLVGTNTTTFSNVNGCDSVVVTNTTLLPTAYGSVSVSGCDSALANGTWYFASTSFNDTLNNQAANGCDSIITYTVSISNSVATTENISACDSANVNGTWYYASQNIITNNTATNGCDSTHTIVLNISNQITTSNNQTACDSAQVFGTWYYASQSVSQTYLSNASCDSVHTVNLTINYASPTTTINNTTCDANLVGTNTTTFSNVNGCDSVVVTNTTLLPTAYGSVSVSGCDSALANGTWYYASTSFNDTLNNQAANGCDSIVTYTVNVSNSVATTENINACDSANVNGTWYYASQNIVTNNTAANGCDSTHTVVLNISNQITTSNNQTACDSAQVFGTWYYASQSVSQTYTAVSGCDSVHTVNLTINYASPTTTINNTTCDANLVGSNTTTYSNANGCDSVVITNTTLLPTAYGAVSVSGCDSALVNGTWYFASTSFNDTLNNQAANGCDSIVTYTVNVSNSVATTENINACDSANVNGTWYYASQNIVTNSTAANGCDSTHTVVLNISNQITTSNNQTACDSAQVFGTWYYASQSVSQTYTAVSGCDSVHTVNLTINYASPTTTINNTTCDANLVGTNTTTFSNANGCDSVVVTNTTLLPAAYGSVSVSGCDSALANSTWYFASTSFNDTLNSQAANGCDSIVTYTVSVSNSVVTTENINACDSANVNGTWYYASQNIVTNNTAANGCDSTHTVVLSISNQITTSNNQTACDSAQVFGTWYYASQSVSQTYTAVSGCDSVHTVNLTINYASPTTTINNTTCDANLVGTNTTTFSNANGCDSVVITNTTLLPMAYGTATVSGCDSALANGTWYYASTSFNDTLNNQAANGCDSIVTYTVSVSNSLATMENINACDSANVNGTWYFASQNIVTNSTAANGCDSTHTVVLSISNQITTSNNQTACDSAQVFGTWYYASQSVSQTYAATSGCDSVHTVNLTINYASPTTTINNTTCDANLIGSNTTTFSNVNGCDSVVITNTTLLPIAYGSVSVSGCDSALTNGTWYFASTSFNDTLNNQAANGCDSIVTYTVSISNSVFNVDTSWVCGNEDSTLYVSHFTAQNGCDSTYYHLVFSTNQTDSTFLTSTTCQAENAGVFTDTFANVYGCDSVVIENIAYQPFEVLVNASDTIIYEGNEVILYSEGENTTSYYWTVNNNAVSTDSSFADYPTETVTYYLLADNGTCDGMDSITIQVLLENTPLIPNSFTPNGDILNDIFRVVNADKYHNITMKIYNRWGAEVYYGSGSNPGWDGTFKLGNQPIDNYNYVIVLESFSGKITTITGSLALFR